MIVEPKEYFTKEIKEEFSTAVRNYDFEDLHHDLSNCFDTMKTKAKDYGHRLTYKDIFITFYDQGYDGDHDVVMCLTATIKIKNENYKQEMIEYYEARKRELEEAEKNKKRDNIRNNINRTADEARREYKKSSSEDRLAQRVSSILSASISDGSKLEELKKLVEMNR